MDLHKRLSVAQEVSLSARNILLDHYEKVDLHIEHKGATDLLTEADLKSQKIIVEALSTAFPDDQILAEEGAEFPKNWKGPIWIIDPLDGTNNFSRGFPSFGISIAFVVDGKTQVAVMDQPLLKESFTAVRGEGAFCNGRSIHVSSRPKLKDGLVASGFPYDRRENPNNNLREFAAFELNALCVRRAGAAAVDLAYVACGRLEGFWEPRLAPWDIAAGMLLIEEAGGKVSTYGGSELTDYACGEILASNGAIHGEMIDILRQAKDRFPALTWA